MQVRVLGPIDAVDDEGTNISVGGSIPTRLLALLVATEGDVSVDDLVVDLWPGDDRPNDPVASLRTYVARLRGSLGSESILTRTGAYAFGDVETDARQFEELVVRARRASGSPVVADLWRQASSLWRGPAFAGYADSDAVRREANRLEEMRAEATEAWFDARLAAGEGRELAADVDAAIDEFPLREGFRAQQMTVLARAGRQAEALRAFQEFRGDLTEIGLEPSERLVELEGQIAGGEVPRSGARRTLRGYELGERLGEGAFAIVHAATQASVDRPVAIKQIRSELADQPNFIRQFEAEAHLVARLEHPHIVPLYDYWREPGSAFLVMRHLDGGSLGARLLDGPLELDQLGSMVNQVASGLDEAHRAGIVHRDVKPANILLDGADNAYLSDFGIAVEEQERLDPEAWLSNGSPAYAPPEQLRRELVGAPADVHALGVSVFEALTGQLPFPGETTMAGLLERQLNDPIPLARSSNPDVPAAVDSVIQKATAKDPAARHQSAGDFARDFARAAGLDGEDELIEPEDRNPYKGLRAFDQGDAGDFTGRDRLIAQLVATMKEHRTLLVVGPSGSGKSSVVRAGLLPRLTAGGLPGSERWFTTTMVPGSKPFADLASALLRVAVDPPADVEAELSRDANGIAKTIRKIIPNGREVVLVLDQFEELFTLSSTADRDLFLSGLVVALTEESPRLRLVATLRADFYDHPLRHPDFADLISDATVPVRPLAADELEKAITEPARSVGASFESGLVAEITADVADQPGALPLLQYARTELFDRRVDQRMTKQAYAELGGVTGALARRADEVYESSSVEAQVSARRVFGRLVNLGEGTEDTRRRVVRSELGGDSSTAAVLDDFGTARLLAFDRDAATREPTVEVAHEALIREWPRLRSWLAEDRDGLRIQRHLTETSSAWDGSGREPGELYRGGRLEAAEEWSSEHGEDLNEIEADFLAASAQQRDAEIEAEARSTRRLRRSLAGVAVVAALALVTSVLAFQQRGQANESADEAEQNAALAEEQRLLAEEQALVAEEQSAIALSNAELAENNAATAETRRLIADAASLTDENYDIALLLAAEAYNRDPSPAGLAGLQRVLVESDNFLGRLGAGTPYAWVAWTEQGLIGITADEIQFFDQSTGQVADSIALPAPLASRFISRASADVEAETLALALQGGTVLIVDLVSRETSSFEHGVEISNIALNVDATQIVVGDRERNVSLVELDDSQEVWRASGLFPENSFADLDYPSDLVRGGNYGLYTSAGLTEVIYGNGITAVGFDQQGDVLAAVGGAVRRLSRETGSEENFVAPFAGFEGELFPLPAFFFYPVGDEIVLLAGPILIRMSGDFELIDTRMVETGRRDDNIGPRWTFVDDDLSQISVLESGQISRGYSLITDSETYTTEFVSGTLTQTAASNALWMAIDPTGRTAAIATPNGIVVTSLAGQQLLGRSVATDGHFEVGASPDGTRLVASTLASGREPLVLDLATEPATPLEVQTDHPLETLVFLPNAEVMLGGVFVDDLVLLDARDLTEIMEIPSATFGDTISPDGQTFVQPRAALVTDRAEILFFDLASRRQTGSIDMSSLSNGADQFRMSAYSPDGSRLVTVTEQGVAFTIDPFKFEVIEVREPDPTTDDSITAIAFSPVEPIAATRSVTGRIDIRDSETLEILWSLEGGTSAAENLTLGPYFSPDGRYLLTTRGVLPRLWDLETRTDLGSFPNERVAVGTAGTDQVRLVTGVGDNAMIWNLQPETWPEIACQAAGRNMTPEEWEQFGPSDEPYRATCPQWPSLDS